MTLPVKSLSEIEVKSEVSENDKILILDSESEEARLASKEELKGDKGDDGEPGTPGAAATVTVGTTSTLPAGSSATVSNSGTSSAAVFNFGIPKGDTGNPGADGNDGNGISSITSSKVGKITTVTITETNGDSESFQISDGADGQGSGDVLGPASSVDGNVAVFDGTTGKLIKDGSIALSTLSAGASAGATAVQPGDIGTAAACNTGTSSGNVPILDSNGKLATSTLPGVALTDTFTVSTSADLTTLSSADQGDIAIVTLENKTYVLSVAPYSTAANWKEILAPTGGVTSVNGQTGAVTVSEFTPGGTATTGYVVKKTASGYEWAAESGAVTSVNGQTGAVTVQAVLNQLTSAQIKTGTATTDSSVTASALAGAVPVLSTQANNLLTSGMKIWVGTQANYEALGSYDNSTAYLTL